ncbi:MAG: hypothetical protein QHI38_12505 [Armatimonadota bacterium]|nr:hypothetical protein [Armatimonadota bacterium]
MSEAWISRLAAFTMMFNHKFRTLGFALLLSVLTAATSSAAGLVKLKTKGTYTDSSGAQHAWTINDGHTLVWDGKPYLPVGVVLHSRSARAGASEEDLQADIAALRTLKSSGITDVLISPGAPITAADPALLQKLINYLDTEGFSYGLAFCDGPADPLKGYVISPSRYRLEGPNPETRLVYDWQDVDSAIYVVARKSDSSVKSLGGAAVSGGKVTINLSEPLGPGEVLIVYPRKVFKPAAEGGCGDLWSGLGEYRDRLLTFFKQLKFGPGLRFFIDPFVCRPGLASEISEFLPDSTGFRLGLEAFLTRKYTHEGGVNTAWGFVDLVDTIQEACRVIPLWAQGRGLAYTYDRTTGKLYSLNALTSQLWSDVASYRDTSLQEHMNAIADVLHKYVADVPVVFTCAQWHRAYANPYGMGGYDGLAAAVDDLDEAAVANAVGPAYSLAEESAKTTWFLSFLQMKSGVQEADSLLRGFDLLQEIGCKGIFVDVGYSKTASAGAENQAAEPAGALARAFGESRRKLDTAADYKPLAVSYPTVPNVGAYPRKLDKNTWWLPSLRVGTTSYIGDGLFAYSFVGEDKTYLWSGIGPRTITLKSGPTGYPTVEFPERASISKKKGGQFTVALTDIPLVLRGIDIRLVFPYETALTEMQRLADVVVEADKAGFDVKNARAALENAKLVLEKGSPLTAYGMLQQNLLELLKLLGGDLWIEGEVPSAHSFDGVSAHQGASGNLVLRVDTSDDPPLSPFTAAYAVDVPMNSSYEVWLAATPPNDASRMSFAVDDGIWQPVGATGDVQHYARGLAWFKIGTANLTPGRHTISFRVDGRRLSDNRYYVEIDALVLSPKGFKPNGVIKPY